VSGADRRQLEAWLRSHSAPQALATRARIVLGSADGESIRALAERLDITQRTVGLWRRRYRERWLAGLRTLARSGRPRRISAAKEQAVISATLRKPKAATRWSGRRLAKEVGLSPATGHRIWQKYGLQPHRVETFKFSADPEFDRKLTDVVGLYLDPPERALALCVDEKSQIQALDRTQRLLPMWPGLPARWSDPQNLDSWRGADWTGRPGLSEDRPWQDTGASASSSNDRWCSTFWRAARRCADWRGSTVYRGI